MSFHIQLFLFSFLPLLLALFLLKSYISSSKFQKNLPPSPPKWPIIGNLHQLGSGMHRILQSMSQTYGPVILLHIGTTPVIVASSVDAAREILKTHDIAFSNRPSLTLMDKITYGSKDIAFARYGEYWRQVKSICVLHLLSNKRVQSYQQVREDEMDQMIRKIQRANGSVINMSELLSSLSNSVVSRVALGRTYEGREVNHILDQVLKLTQRFSVENYIPSLAWVDRLSGLHREANGVAKEIDDFLERVVGEHENKKELGVEGHDLVDILLEIQRDTSIGFHLERYMIKAITWDMFAAGTDTTSTTLEWAISELLRNPHTMEELQQEARKIGRGRPMTPEEDIDKMPYLKAVLKEALRLHTPLPLLVPHETTKDVRLLGYDIPSGTQVIINAWAIARDPLIWEEPEKFRPERFLNTPIDYTGVHFELIPFGAGRRGCPGTKFAMTISELALANLVYKFEFEVQGEHELDMTEKDGMTVHRMFPLLVKATPL